MADEDAHVILKANSGQVSSSPSSLEEEEEALSLCDLPLNDMSSNESRRPSLSEASELFEFFNDVVSDMCPADEIFFGGKLVPSKHEPQPNSPPLDQKPIKESNNPPAYSLRSDPISGLQSPVSRSHSVGTFSNSPRSMKIRSSRSLDYRKLHGSSSSVVFLAPEAERNSSNGVKRATKPRWYAVMFGTVKVPPEMGPSDMKNRKVRRNPSTTMFPAATDAGGKQAENRSSDKVSWRILKALTCNDPLSVSVTTSLAVI